MDYIPAKIADRAAWYSNFDSKITAAPVSYGLTAPQAAVIAAAVLAFSNAYAASSDPSTRTSATVAATTAADAAAKATCRPYAMQINANPAVTDEQRVDLGLKVRSTTPTPTPPPATSPVLSLSSQGPGVVTIASADSSTPSRKAKPAGVIGLELALKVGTAFEVDPNAAPIWGTTTKSPVDIALPAMSGGKHVTLFGRWVTRSGASGIAQKGPWSTALQTFGT